MKNKPAWFLGLPLVLLTALLYWPVTHYEFLNYDDHLFTIDNPVVPDGLTWQGVAWAFRSCAASNWHPVTWLSHMLDGSLFYLYPGGHHLTNLVFHLANTLLLFQFLRRLSGGARWRCALTAALFAWHPLHVESVAWVAERKDVLSTFFLILSLWAYVRYVEVPRARRYLVALGLFALGLMSKPMLVTTPFLLLLLDFWPLGRFPAIPSPFSPRATLRLWSGPLLEKVPFLVLSLASCIVTVIAQHGSGALRSLDAVPLPLRIANALVAYAGYLCKLIWPADLAVFYPLPEHRPIWLVLGSVCALAAISYLVWRGRRERPWLIFGWLWFLGTLVPVIGLVQVGGQSMADRYTYVPFIGLFILIAWGLAEIVERRPMARRAILPAVFGALLVCLALAHAYLRCWENSRALFEHAIHVTRNNFLAHNNLGVALKNEGRIAEAMTHYREAARINPDYAGPHFNLAINLAEQDQVAPALFQFSEVARLGMDSAEQCNAFGVALAQKGHVAEAVQQFSQAVRRDPLYAKARYNLAFGLASEGKTADAIAAYRAALRLQPRWPEALQSLAWLLATHENSRFRDGPEAVRLAEEACQLTGHLRPGYLDTLAAAYAEANRAGEAITTAEKALELAKGSKETDLISAIEGRLRLYRAGKPFHQT